MGKQSLDKDANKGSININNTCPLLGLPIMVSILKLYHF